jgi:hypothetical protein
MSHSSIMKLATIAVAALLLAGVAAGQKKSKSKAEPAGKTITASGCVEAGVEAGCLVLKDSKTGTLYNLFFKSNPPEINTAIRFTGTQHDGPTTCMQGTPVDVKTFTKLKMHCPAASTEKKAPEKK